MTEPELPDHIVLRAGPDLPEGWMPAHLEGRWYDRNDVPIGPARPAAGASTAVAEPSGRFEVADDGAVAEVWEVRPGYR